MSHIKLKDWALILFTLAFVVLIGDIAIKTHVITIQNKLREIVKEELSLNDTRRTLIQFLKVYTAYDNNGPLKLVRYGKDNDGGYIVPEKALSLADALLGYGIDQDSSFEEDFSRNYKKPSYGFDCGVNYTDGKEPLFTFINECIGNDKFIYYDQTSSSKVSSFDQQLDNLKLRGKKVFIKMDIEGAEFDALEDILNYYYDITGIAVEVHTDLSLHSIQKSLKLLRNLERHFVLVHLHGQNVPLRSYFPGVIGQIPAYFELTYINKSLVTNYHIAQDQRHPTSLDMPALTYLPDVQFEILP